MAHHSPKACESYCCWNCGGVLTSNPCGIYWYTTDTGYGRVIDASDEVVGTGPQGSIEVPTGTYRLQVQCAVGGEWITANEVDHIADETMCNCCDIMEPYQSHTLSNLDHLTSDCVELPATLTFPTKFGYDWTGNVIATPCGSSYYEYQEYPVLTTIGAVQAAACWTGSYLGVPYWVAMSRYWLTVDVIYSASRSAGSITSVRLQIDSYITDGSILGIGGLYRQWRSQLACPPERDWRVIHRPEEDVSTFPPLVGVTTENLILNTDL